MNMDPFITRHVSETVDILQALDVEALARMVEQLDHVRARGGRLFLLGVGGCAAHCSHAANDFRKLANFEAYAPTDNVAELTARTNDEGWADVFSSWLKTSRLKTKDAVLVLSVGGGNGEKNISANLVGAVDYANGVGATVLGIVGRDGGHTARHANVCVLIPALFPDSVTPHTEAIQSVILHLMVTHPLLKTVSAKWESMSTAP